MKYSLPGNLLKHKRPIKYIIAGGTAATVELSSLYFLTDILGVWYLASASLAFALAFFVSFFLQKFWTFRDSDKERMYRQMAVYFIMALINLTVILALMYILVDGFKIWYMLAQVIAGGLIACESYLINKLFIFNKNRRLRGKILIATGIYPPDFRGPATMLEALPGALENNNFQVKVITYSDVKGAAGEKGKVYRIIRRGPAITRFIKYFCLMFFLSLGSDIIYCTDLYSVGYFSYLLKKLTGKKYIVRFAGDSAWETAVRLGLTRDYIVDFQTKVYSRRVEKLKARRKRIMLKADKVIAVSEFLGGVARQMSVDAAKIKLIYNSIDFIKIDFVPEKIGRIKSRYGAEAKIIVTAGQLNPWKGFDGVIKSLPKIMEKLGYNVHLLILGQGQEMENLKKLALELRLSANVHFLGRIEHGEIMNYFKAADLFILNSNYEGLSHTLLEVMKAGAPIVATDIEANREVIENNKNGFLVDYNNAGEISRAAIKILANQDLAESFTGQAREKLKIFNWDKTVKLTIEAIEEII